MTSVHEDASTAACAEQENDLHKLLLASATNEGQEFNPAQYGICDESDVSNPYVVDEAKVKPEPEVLSKNFL